MGSRGISCPLLLSVMPITIASWHGDRTQGLEKSKRPSRRSFLLSGGMFAALQERTQPQELPSGKRFRANIALQPPFHSFLSLHGVSRGSTHNSESGKK